MKKLIDKQLENQLNSVFIKQDLDKRGALTYSQFESFLRLNCFDFILDFNERPALESALFSEGRVTFPEILRFIDEQATFKHTKKEYKESLGFFMRGSDGKQAANAEDIAEALRKYTDLSEEEVAGFLATHDLNDLIEEGMLDMEESARLMYKY